MGLNNNYATICNTVIYDFILSFGIIGSLLQALCVIPINVSIVSVSALHFILPNCCFVWWFVRLVVYFACGRLKIKKTIIVSFEIFQAVRAHLNASFH